MRVESHITQIVISNSNIILCCILDTNANNNKSTTGFYCSEPPQTVTDRCESLSHELEVEKVRIEDLTSGKSYCDCKYSEDAGRYVNQPQNPRRQAANNILNMRP